MGLYSVQGTCKIEVTVCNVRMAFQQSPCTRKEGRKKSQNLGCHTDVNSDAKGYGQETPDATSQRQDTSFALT